MGTMYVETPYITMYIETPYILISLFHKPHLSIFPNIRFQSYILDASR